MVEQVTDQSTQPIDAIDVYAAKRAVTERARLQRYYYRNKFRVAVILILCLIVINAVCGAYAYILLNRPHPQKFYTTNQIGNVKRLYPVRM